jgi:hypothetical protein
MNRFIVIICLLSSSVSMMGQQEIGLHFMRDLWQANQTNPAFLPSTKFNIGIVAVANHFELENITFNNAIQENADGSRTLNVDKVINALDANSNVLREQLSVETINLGLTFGRFTLGVGHAVRFNAFMDYPRALPELIWEGNAQFIGQEVQFAPSVDLNAYNEFSLGVALEMSPMVTIGGRVKYLTGLANASSGGNDLRLLTSDDAYQLTLDGNYTLNSSGVIDYDGFDQLTFDLDSEDFQDFFTRNTGWAFDLGIHAKFGKFDLAVSALDLGKITWDENVTNYTVSTPAEFTGIDVAQQILDDAESIGSVIDSLRAQYDVTETNNAFTNKLPRRLYASLGYQFSDRWHFGALFYNESFRDENYSAYALSATTQLLSWLQMGATYAVKNETFDNLGVNAVVKVGPVQLFAMTDNILTAFSISDSNNAHARIGLNLAFSRRDGSRRRNDIDSISDQERFFE